MRIKTNGKWWKGEVVLGYNLRTLVLLLGAVLALAATGLLLWGLWCLLGLLWDGLCWLLSALWVGICWLASKWLWLLGAAALAALIWALSRIKWERKPHDHKEWKTPRWLWWALAALLLLLLAFLLFRSCGSDKDNDPTPIEAPEAIYEAAWDDVVVLRAYLDGVQDTTLNGRRWVGIKNVGLRPVGDAKVAGTTYEASEEIVSEDWKTLIFQLVEKPESLSRDQMAGVILYAMRCGRYGFAKSDFLADINLGNMDKAKKDITLLHKANGAPRTNGQEAKQYLWVVKQVFCGNFTADQAVDLPMFSYKTLNVETATTADLLNAKSSWRTPRQALGL